MGKIPQDPVLSGFSRKHDKMYIIIVIIVIYKQQQTIVDMLNQKHMNNIISILVILSYHANITMLILTLTMQSYPNLTF